MKAPSCFEAIDVVVLGETIIPNYSIIFSCFWELSTAFDAPLKDIWHDEALSEKIIQCYRSFVKSIQR